MRGFYYYLSRLTMLSLLVITVSIDSYKEQDNCIKGFNEPRYILIQTLNSNQNRSATLTIRTRRCNKKLIDNNQHCCNKKQYFLSLSLIMFKKSYSHLWCALTWQMRRSAVGHKGGQCASAAGRFVGPKY